MKFNKGDRVRCLDAHFLKTWTELGKDYTYWYVVSDNEDDYGYVMCYTENPSQWTKHSSGGWKRNSLELAPLEPFEGEYGFTI